jgi:hypothetical protein
MKTKRLSKKDSKALAIFRNRFPSRQESFVVLAVVIAISHSWSIWEFLRVFPALSLYLNVWKILYVFAYTQAFALIESIIIGLFLILLGAILPARLFRDKFVAQSSIMVLVSALWAIATLWSTSPYWAIELLLIRLTLYVALIGLACMLVHRLERLERALESMADRLTVLSFIYVPLGVLGILAMLLNNLSGRY